VCIARNLRHCASYLIAFANASRVFAGRRLSRAKRLSTFVGTIEHVQIIRGVR
jgi:hypothetical protein